VADLLGQIQLIKPLEELVLIFQDFFIFGKNLIQNFVNLELNEDMNNGVELTKKILFTSYSILLVF
jgi:hypothetical protein